MRFDCKQGRGDFFGRQQSRYVQQFTSRALLFTELLADSIKAAAKTVANGVLSTYTGNQSGEIPGIYDSPYYWWSAGQVWDSLIDYWFLTGDASYNTIVNEALGFQVGPNSDYMPPNQTKTEVNYTIPLRLYFANTSNPGKR